MLSDLLNQLIKSIHDLINHPSAATVIGDVAATAEDVVGVIPEVAGNKAALVADAVNAVVSVAQAQLPNIVKAVDPNAAPAAQAAPANNG